MHMTMRFSWAGPLGLLLVACGGSTSSTGDNGGSQGITPGSCSVAAGTYTEHFTLASGTNCPAVPDETVTVNANEMFTGTPPGMSVSGASDGGSGCTTNTNTSTCTLTLSCDFAFSGISESVTGSFTYGASSITGQESVDVSEPGGPMLNCMYDVTATKN
jgi:hypothetical protein